MKSFITPILLALVRAQSNQDFETFVRDGSEDFETFGRDVSEDFETLGRDANEDFETLGRDANEDFETFGRDPTNTSNTDFETFGGDSGTFDRDAFDNLNPQETNMIDFNDRDRLGSLTDSAEGFDDTSKFLTPFVPTLNYFTSIQKDEFNMKGSYGVT